MRILAISGSLRGESSNSRLLRAAERVAPEGIVIRQYSGIEQLPHFNPDLDHERPPDAVARFRAEIGEADGLMISSPEYAHGVPGSLKNALDWLVGSGEIIGKPVALINASARATRAHASLADTLTVMSARVIPEASVTIPLDGRKGLDETAMIADPAIAAALRGAIDALARRAGDEARAAIP